MPVAVVVAPGISIPALFDPRGESDNNRVTNTAGDARKTSPVRHAFSIGNHSRKAHSAMIMTQPSTSRPRRIRAAIIGFGFDGDDDQQRVTRSAQCLAIGGSRDTHDELRETMIRLEIELDERQQDLGDLNPEELAELAFRIDLPELQHLALRLDAGLELQGRGFEDLSAEELTALLNFEDAGAAVES